MVVAMIALLLAASGTAVAASTLVNGNKLIKKHSLSGNRLHNHTITGTQVNMGKLGKVRSAKHADSASTATNATNAKNATNATNATNAIHATTATNATSAGHATAAGTADNIKTWFTTTTPGNTATLLTVGPFTYTGVCGGTTATPTATTKVSTSQANSSLQSYEGNSLVTFGPTDGAQLIGDNITSAPPQFYGPDDGSDAVISGDGHKIGRAHV